jgi:lipooligosaccharide transport system permease protein
MAVETRRTRDELPDVPAAPEMLLRAFAYWVSQYKRTWRGTSITMVLEPLGFLAAMGLGLGMLVDRGTGTETLPGVGYLEFIAPGLLAATAMMTATFESTYPVMGAIKWNRQYVAQLATPLRVPDVLAGHVLFVAARLVLSTSVFLLIMLLFGAIGSPWAAALLPVGVLTGVAYAPAIFAFSATRENDAGFAMLFRFGVMPMFLFSGTFFPVDQLPDWLEPAAWLVPLWHGVDLARDLAIGSPSLGEAALHIGYLAAWAVGGFLVALRAFEKRLVT